MNIEVTTGSLPRNNSLNSPIQQRNTQIAPPWETSWKKFSLDVSFRRKEWCAFALFGFVETDHFADVGKMFMSLKTGIYAGWPNEWKKLIVE